MKAHFLAELHKIEYEKIKTDKNLFLWKYQIKRMKDFVSHLWVIKRNLKNEKRESSTFKNTTSIINKIVIGYDSETDTECQL